MTKIKVGKVPLTPHPCFHLPDGAAAVFDGLIAGQQPEAPCPWIAVLERHGLIKEGPARQIGASALKGAIMAPTYLPTENAADLWRAHQRSVSAASVGGGDA